MNVSRPSGTTAYSYDLNGNLITSNNYSFSYNAANRMSSSSSSHGVTSYNYNGLGQRVRKQTINNSLQKTTWFIYEGSNLLHEDRESNNNNVQFDYIYLNGNLIGLVELNNSNIINMYHIQTDTLGTPRTITNATDGSLVWSWDNSEAFGNNSNSNTGLEFNLRFSGQYFDDEKGSSYNINRDYASGLGRYIQSDPIGLNGGINTYGYVQGNPLSYNDPMGLSVRILVISSGEVGPSDPGHVGIQIDNNVYGFYPKTRYEGSINFIKNVDKAAYNPGQIINQSWNHFLKEYKGQRLHAFELNLSNEQEEILKKRIDLSVLNRNRYNILSIFGWEQCTSYTANLINNIEPSMSLPGFSPDRMLEHLTEKNISGHKIIKTYDYGIMEPK